MFQKKFLIRLLLFGGAGFSLCGLTMVKFIENKMTNSAAYQEAVKIVKTDKITKEFLGEPIFAGFMNIFYKNACGDEGDIKWITIPVQGQKESGNLKYWYYNDKGKHTLLQIELLDDNNKNIIFYKKIQDKRILDNLRIVNKER